MSTLPKQGEDEEDHKENIIAILQEIEIMKKLKHPNTVGFVDHCKSPTAHYLFMEFCSEGDLKKFIPLFNQGKYGEQSIQTLRESDAKYVIREIVQGLDYLSSKMIMHRDIKPDNIMVNRKPGFRKSDPVEITNFEFKLGDMGLAKAMFSKNQLN